MRFRHFLRAVFMGLSIATVSLAASADVVGAQSFVEREQGQIQKLVAENAPSAKVTSAIDAMVDYDAVAQRALGKPCPATIPNCTNHWDQLNDAQKKEITELFRQIVEKKYRENAQKTKNFEVTYKGSKEQGADISKIRTEAKDKTKPREPAVRVDYIIRSDSGNHKVIDLVTEGSILTKNYYDQSHKMLTTPGQGYPYLVQKLKEKVKKK